MSGDAAAHRMKEIHTAKSAWVVTWVGTSGVPADPLVAVMNYRRTSESVRDFVEQFYIVGAYDSRAKLLFAKRSKDNPFRAHLHPFERIICGSGPFLYARRVTDLRYANNQLTWSEPRSTDELRKELIDVGLLLE